MSTGATPPPPDGPLPAAAADLEQSVHGSPDAVAVLDGRMRVVFWNRAAEKLLGHAGADVRGKVVHDVLRMRDVFGNPLACFCGAWEAVRRGEPVRPTVVEVTTGTGERVRVVVELEAPVPAEPSRGLVCRFRPDRRRPPVDRRGAAHATPQHPGGPAQPKHRPHPETLSRAELAVLRLLCAGKRAEEVAQTLGNSPLTIRNHIQHILRKLGARNQAQAISVAIRAGLV